MAQRKGGPAVAAKPKLRKKHGPKRKMFHKYNKVMRMNMASCGMLSKFNDYESFCLSMNSRGVRTCLEEMWFEFTKLPKEKQIEYFAHARENSKRLEEERAKREKSKGKK